jgi:hypothetical protein
MPRWPQDEAETLQDAPRGLGLPAARAHADSLLRALRAVRSAMIPTTGGILTLRCCFSILLPLDSPHGGPPAALEGARKAIQDASAQDW